MGVGHEFIPGLAGAPCSVVGDRLVIRSFVLVRDGQRYVHHGPQELDLSVLARGSYRIWVIQDFDTESCNPDLGCSLARVCALPVDRYRHSVSPTHFPMESRPLDYLGVLVVR